MFIAATVAGGNHLGSQGTAVSGTGQGHQLRAVAVVVGMLHTPYKGCRPGAWAGERTLGVDTPGKASAGDTVSDLQ